MGLGLTGKLDRAWVHVVVLFVMLWTTWIGGWEWEDPRPCQWDDPGMVMR